MANVQTDNFSIISGFDGTCFQRHYVDQDFGNRCLIFVYWLSQFSVSYLLDVLPLIAMPRFTFSKAHKYRLQCYYSEPGLVNFILLWSIDSICLPGTVTGFYFLSIRYLK